MAYQLTEINDRARRDPLDFLRECDDTYELKLRLAAARIREHSEASPLIFLSGPSGSGKTTTALKIEELLDRSGMETHTVALDNYFRTVDPETCPMTPEGKPDLESPDCLDMELLSEHFHTLEQGKTIEVPRYDFKSQTQTRNTGNFLNYRSGDLVIFEGIHALNDTFSQIAPSAFRLYISARSNVEQDGTLLFKGTWMRLCRRVVRDHQFRGTSPADTLQMWANVRRGEKQYISPYKEKADLMFDSSFMCEVSVMKSFVEALFREIPQGADRYAELASIVPALSEFEAIDPTLVPSSSLLREFIGGGSYQY